MIGPRAAMVAIAAAVAFVATGCADADGGDDSGGGGGAVDERAAPEAPSGADGSAGDSEEGQARPGGNLIQVQHLVHTAQLAVQVTDVLAAVRRTESMATGSGGLVHDENVSAAEDGGVESAEITIRVPSDTYERTLRDIADLGTLHTQSRQVKDVTREVVDIESRIATQRESIERVRAILADATKIADVVSLEAELTRRQADLESMLAQQEALSGQVSLATIMVHFFAADEEPPSEDDDLGFVTGLKEGWQVFVGVVAILLTVLGAVLPFAAVGVPIALLVIWLLRVVRRSDQPAA